ncbi:GNAT family N-acetyltransferase [Mucilaginibacter antarcticus]|uniref:GNAT family N-acetyltransferase n=1 Tax=Mucilaginibacter antarcticus TaxID=1855725 RepID=A0ABW5XUJ2_9SPHI
MEIKRIQASEWQLIVRLFDQYRVFYKQESDLTLAEHFIRERLNNNESVIYVAMANDRAIGFTQLYPKYSSVRVIKNWILNDLFVDTEYRKQGIGAKLIEKAAEFAKTGGSAFIQLETAVDNYTAQSLYEGMGFIKQAPDEEYYLYKLSLN